MSIIGIIITVVLGVIEMNGTVILSPEVTASAVSFLGVLALYFRRQA
jgi:xanthine/uracil/vitamin C permease (AzgA family)